MITLLCFANYSISRDIHLEISKGESQQGLLCVDKTYIDIQSTIIQTSHLLVSCFKPHIDFSGNVTGVTCRVVVFQMNEDK